MTYLPLVQEIDPLTNLTGTQAMRNIEQDNNSSSNNAVCQKSCYLCKKLKKKTFSTNIVTAYLGLRKVYLYNLHWQILLVFYIFLGQMFRRKHGGREICSALIELNNTASPKNITQSFYCMRFSRNRNSCWRYPLIKVTPYLLYILKIDTLSFKDVSGELPLRM